MDIILHAEDTVIRDRLTDGLTGLELESQRIDRSGHLSKTPHPFPDDPYIDRDFGEAQTEIGTAPFPTVAEAAAHLRSQLGRLHTELSGRDELLWPFSNPPLIRDASDILVAAYTGERAQKTAYRQYLAEKYGKYKMTFSGIHFNYSFDDTLIRRNSEIDGASDYRRYKDGLYLSLAQKVLEYGWVPVALLSASPLLDISFYESGRERETVFTGMASLRCSEAGYWNQFAPFVCYDDIESYTASITKYLENGMLIQATELYYPVRVKNKGVYRFRSLFEDGIDHIELRTIDLNPFSDCGVEVGDMQFLQLFLIWLSSLPERRFTLPEMIQALYNSKAAAAYDWKIARIIHPDGRSLTLQESMEEVMARMVHFYTETRPDLLPILTAQRVKIREAEERPAYKVRRRFGADYIGLGLERAAAIQETFIDKHTK